MFGVALILVRSIGLYILYTGNFPINENFVKWQHMLMGISYLGQFVIGVGFFLSFVIINERLKIHKHFKILNIAYLATITPNLYYFYVFFFENYLYNPPLFISRLYHFGLWVLTAITYLLFVILFVMIFISLQIRKKTENNDFMVLDNHIYTQEKNSKDKVIRRIE